MIACCVAAAVQNVKGQLAQVLDTPQSVADAKYGSAYKSGQPKKLQSLGLDLGCGDLVLAPKLTEV
jgi:hypothetical protein